MNTVSQYSYRDVYDTDIYIHFTVEGNRIRAYKMGPGKMGQGSRSLTLQP